MTCARVLVVLAALTFAARSQANPYDTTQTFTVTSLGSSVNEAGTLPWAVNQANYYGADVNYINFNIPNLKETDEIVLTTELYIARLMILDATTQPGYAGVPLIRINTNGLDTAMLLVGYVAGVPPFSDGTPATSGGNPAVHGVSAASAGSTIQGFQFFGFKSNAITIFKESEGNFVQNNWIGFAEVPGTTTYLRNAATFPNADGIGIQSNFNTIRSNTISGVKNGIDIGEPIELPWSGRNYFTNDIESNNIGTDPSGSFVIGNDSDGIFLGAGASEEFIGPFNVLSGMASSGVEMLHSSNYGNIIIANFIGVDRTGMVALGNGELGVLIANGADYNDVGGPSGGNVISGNRLGGVSVGTVEFPAPNTRTYVESNLIGTDATGMNPIGEQNTGITSQFGSETIMRRNVIGGHLNHGVVLNSVGPRSGGTQPRNGLFGNWIGTTASATPLRFNPTRGPNQGIHLLSPTTTTGGLPIPNQAFGVYVLNSFGNYMQIPTGTENGNSLYLRNVFGTNDLGAAAFDGCTAADNIYYP
jgi:hypothetical protein